MYEKLFTLGNGVKFIRLKTISIDITNNVKVNFNCMTFEFLFDRKKKLVMAMPFFQLMNARNADETINRKWSITSRHVLSLALNVVRNSFETLELASFSIFLCCTKLAVRISLAVCRLPAKHQMPRLWRSWKWSDSDSLMCPIQMTGARVDLCVRSRATNRKGGRDHFDGNLN